MLKWVYSDYASRNHMYTMANCYGFTTTGIYTYYDATHFKHYTGEYYELNWDYPTEKMRPGIITTDDGLTRFDFPLYVYLNGNYYACNCYKTRAGNSSFVHLTRGSHMLSTKTSKLVSPSHVVMSGKNIAVTSVSSGSGSQFYFGIRLSDSRLKQVVSDPIYEYNGKITKFKSYASNSELSSQQVTNLSMSNAFKEENLTFDEFQGYMYCYFCTPYKDYLNYDNTVITLQYEKTESELTSISYLRPNGLFLRNTSA
jgi:hypothetical protein